jgi:hypothetical protein
MNVLCGVRRHRDDALFDAPRDRGANSPDLAIVHSPHPSTSDQFIAIGPL